MSVLPPLKWSRYIPADRKPTPKQLAFLMLPHREALYGGAAGGGKSLATNYTLVLTPYGFRPLKEIKVGHKVCTPDGTAYVIGVYPQGVRPCYKITFQDGSTSICDEDHLWQYSVAGKGKWRKSGKEWKLATTLQLIEMMENGRELLTPVCEPAQFTKNYRFDMRKIDPWLIGALIGDGCLTNPNEVKYVSNDQELLDRTKALYQWGERTDKRKSSSVYRELWTRDISLIKELKRLGLMGKYAHEKVIPESYLYNNVEGRWELLRGLMDTDGTISQDGKAYYSTTSKKLAKQIKWLVASLGGRATVTSKNPVVGDMLGRKAYTVYITFRDNSLCVSLTRKKELGRTKPRELKRKIVSIEYFGKEDCLCIKIDDPRGLFLIDDFVVTHNTEALCMDALRWMDVPGFSCVLFRRKITDHALKNSCLNRILTWVEPFLKTGEMRYNGNEHTLYSIEGGMMTFGYIDKAETETRYQGAEYHLAIFDELTQFLQDQYLYIFSRLRRTASTSMIPVRMRSGTNPGNRGHGWVKKRFRIERNEDGEFRGQNLKRPFIQAKVRDNPHLNHRQYEEALGELGELEKARLRDGDWSASEKAVYKDTWFRNRWLKKGEYYQLVDEKQRRVFHESQVFLFGATDAAASERTGLEGKVFFNNQEPSWSVEGIFGMTPDFDLLWIDNWRGQVTIPSFIERACHISQVWHPAVVVSEDNSINKGFVQGCESRGLPMLPVPSIADKIARSTSAQLLASKGRIWLPTYAEWLPDLEDELFVWQGGKGEVDDQIDVLSLAGSYVAAKSHGLDMDSDLKTGLFTAHPTSSEGLYPTRLAGTDQFLGATGGLWK